MQRSSKNHASQKEEEEDLLFFSTPLFDHQRPQFFTLVDTIGKIHKKYRQEEARLLMPRQAYSE